MRENAGDPLALGQRVVAILETGARTATYKLALLTALIDFCVENLPDDPEAQVSVPIHDLAARVLELYWHQIRPFESHTLRQSSQPVAIILRLVSELREMSGAGDMSVSPVLAAARVPAAYSAVIDQIALTLVQQPIHRLQKLPGGSAEPFLYDDSWMHDHVSRKSLKAHGDQILLFPGVAWGLARLSGLLKPTLEIMWVEDVRRLNRYLDADVPNVAGHLFGRERISLAPARAALISAYGARCFYCDARLQPGSPVDHVLPWSRLGIDGLANLVLACARCNTSKSQALPCLDFVDRALARDRVLLEELGSSIAWPAQYDRVAAVARGTYRGEPVGTPTWQAPGRYLPLVDTHLLDWLR